MTTALVEAPVKIKNILFATDFSEVSSNAIPLVKKLARHYQSNIVALYVRPPVVNPMTPVSAWEMAMTTAKELDEAHRAAMLDMFAGLPIRALVEEGPLDACFNAAIKDNDIDLLVMGTHGRTGVGKFFLGSVAEELFRIVVCPVLTVGQNVNPSRPDLGELKQILYATDLNPASERAAAYAVSLTRDFAARLSLAHIVPDETYAKSSFGVLSEVKERLRKLVPFGTEISHPPAYFAEHGEPAKRILEIADLIEADLIVLGVHPEEGVIGAATHLPIATAHKIVAHANCPVLTIRN
jgi:nucleotide-binding universal stress UspA family protein